MSPCECSSSSFACGVPLGAGDQPRWRLPWRPLSRPAGGGHPSWRRARAAAATAAGAATLYLASASAGGRSNKRRALAAAATAAGAAGRWRQARWWRIAARARGRQPLRQVGAAGGSAATAAVAKEGKFADRLRVASSVASLLCVLDCSVLPALMVALPVVGLASPSNMSALHKLSHQAAVYFVLPIGGTAAVSNYFASRHRPTLATSLLALALIYMCNGSGAILGLLPESARHLVHCGPAHRAINICACALLMCSNYISHRMGHEAGGAGGCGSCCGGHSKDSSRREGPSVLGGIRELAQRYDAFMLDQFGVIHDGKEAYPGAVDALKQLTATGKPIVVLSNSSKRGGSTRERLEKMGFDTSGIVAFITSGDAVHGALAHACGASAEPLAHWPLFERHFPVALGAAWPGRRAVVLGNGDDDEQYCDSCGVLAADAGVADFVLARGVFALLDGERRAGSPDEMWPLFMDAMRLCADRGLPMLVANPDLVRPDGNDSPMPGALAREYEKLGGRTHYVGKPHRLVYELGMAALPAGTSRERVCGIGDVMYTDVLGAEQAGVASALVAAGVHHAELSVPKASQQPVAGGGAPEAQALEGFLAQYDYRPTHVLGRFAW